MHRLRRRIAAIVLALFAAVPVLGVVCNFQCETVEMTQVHREMASADADGTTASECHQTSDSATPQVSVALHHACGEHDSTFGEVAATLTTVRDDASVAAATIAVMPWQHPFVSSSMAAPRSTHGPPLLSPRPASAFIVLRV